MNKVLICGTRTKESYKELVFDTLKCHLHKDDIIIEGCCKNSADEYAEEYARENNIEIEHFPADSGNYLKRNIEMVNDSNIVIAFWDGWSYGTAHTIATAVMKNKTVVVVKYDRR
jgi:hypothetical protein